MQHPNAKRTPAGRYDVGMLVERDGLSFGQVAKHAHASKSTVWEWTTRWRAASPDDRDTFACLRDRSGRPHTSPARTARSVEAHVVLVRQLTGHGPRLAAMGDRVGPSCATAIAIPCEHLQSDNRKATAVSASLIAFYSIVATVVPVLFIAFAFQLGLGKLWKYEEPIYQAYFPVYIALHGCLGLIAEACAIFALLSGSDSDWMRVLGIFGIFVPMSYLVLGLIYEAREMHADFSWERAFQENQQRAEQIREARGRRLEENARRRTASRRALRDGPDVSLGSPLGNGERRLNAAVAIGWLILTVVLWVRDGWSTSTASMVVMSGLMGGVILLGEVILPMLLRRTQRRERAKRRSDSP